MKKALKIVGFVLGGLVLIILVFAAFIQFKSQPDYSDVEIKDLTVELTEERVEHGLMIASRLCNFCHMGESNKLDGRLIEDGDFGVVYGPNVTQDPEAGIGSYTDGELYRLFRTGVKKDGKLALPFMFKSHVMADEDLYSLIAYLRSDKPAVQASSHTTPAFEPGFLVKFLYTIAFRPLPYPEGTVPTPSLQDPVAYGKYLVTGRYVCADCHSTSFETFDFINPEASPGYLAGGNKMIMEGMDEAVITSNLTPHESGIGNYSEDEFIAAVKWGQKKDGSPVKFPMMPYSHLDTTEIQAIYAYLQTVPKLPKPETATLE